MQLASSTGTWSRYWYVSDICHDDISHTIYSGSSLPVLLLSSRSSRTEKPDIPMFPHIIASCPSLWSTWVTAEAVVVLPFVPVIAISLILSMSTKEKRVEKSLIILWDLMRKGCDLLMAGLLTTQSAHVKSDSRCCSRMSSAPMSLHICMLSPSLLRLFMSVILTWSPLFRTSWAAANPPPWFPNPKIRTFIIHTSVRNHSGIWNDTVFHLFLSFLKAARAFLYSFAIVLWSIPNAPKRAKTGSASSAVIGFIIYRMHCSMKTLMFFGDSNSNMTMPARVGILST